MGRVGPLYRKEVSSTGRRSPLQEGGLLYRKDWDRDRHGDRDMDLFL